MSGPIQTLGIVGAGKSGVAIARRALSAGLGVRLATSGPADRTALVAAILTPGAVAVDPGTLAAESDAVVLAVPLRRFRDLPLATLADRVVIDVMNYWPPIDGRLAEYETGQPSSRIVGAALPSSARLVKTLNHIGYHEIEELARPAGAPDRVALGVAGDDVDALDAVHGLLDALGFDAVTTGSLGDSAILQPGSVVFGADLGRSELHERLGLDAIGAGR